MAMNQNHSFVNSLNLVLGDETIHNGEMLSLGSNFIPNQVNESVLISSQVALSNSIATVDFHQQSAQISQSTYLGALGFGQVEFSQRVTEVRRTLITSNRVQFHSFVGYEFSEVTRTSQLLSSTSTIHRFHAPNNYTNDHGNHQSIKTEPSHNSFHLQNQPVTGQTPMSTVYASQNNGGYSHLDPNLGLDLLGNVNLQNSNMGKPNRNLMGAFSGFNNQITPYRNNDSSDDDSSDDGPEISQLTSDSKNESPAEKKRRIRAKYKNKSRLRLVNSGEGLTIVPIQPTIIEDPTRDYS
ncbi:hypothetical protein EZV62_001861 [Acer yangbiense]|uniref:Uncharacterized protein n=1 Tax=Acer yangbiense TaxID=1000413 RepID=A0A5C7IXI3_9ROSI|nr:hypothetical protein EZV62_001861 [Acer yangbiense]